MSGTIDSDDCTNGGAAPRCGRGQWIRRRRCGPRWRGPSPTAAALRPRQAWKGLTSPHGTARTELLSRTWSSDPKSKRITSPTPPLLGRSCLVFSLPGILPQANPLSLPLSLPPSLSLSLPLSLPLSLSLSLSHLGQREAQITLVIHPHRQRVPIRHEHPLPNVELAPPNQQGVLNVFLNNPPFGTVPIVTTSVGHVLQNCLQAAQDADAAAP